jgi:divalent metal cation (Fe/Co/Zn/Cd) transporter
MRGQSVQNKKELEELEARRQRGVKIAIYGSFILNVCLFVAKIVAVVMSGSISLIASAVDSGLDLMSGSIIFITSCLMKRKRNIYLYPAGNSRIEPIGVVIFASAMFVVSQGGVFLFSFLQKKPFVFRQRFKL